MNYYSGTIPYERTYGIDPFINIVQAVCRHYRVSIEEIISPSRTQPLTTARHWAMYFLVADGRYSSVMIGSYFERDHSTVLHAVDRINELIGRYESYQEMHHTLESIIKNK